MQNVYNFKSPAKLNLYLEVKNKRKDGFHNIESLMTFCDLGDSISLEKSDSFKFNLVGPFGNLLDYSNNIIIKAVNGLEKLYNRKFLVNVTLEKKLPISSGMGGGSSNAATIIRAIHDIFEINKTKNFDKFLLSIGADVPFCFYGKSAITTGIGERLKFVDHHLTKNYVLLINPMKEVSTKKIFEKLNIKKHDKAFKNFNNIKIDLNFLEDKENHLEAVASRELPEIKLVLDFLNSKTSSLYSRMTGSGATCFSLYENKKSLESAEKLMKLNFPSYWIKSTKLVNSINDINLV